MSNESVYLVKAKIVTPQDLYCIFAFEVDVQLESIKNTYQAAGNHESFESLSLSSSYFDFIHKIEEFFYYDHLDKQITLDLERFVKRLASDMEFVDKLIDAIKKGKTDKISYFVISGLEHILGVKDLSAEFFIQEKTEEETPEKDENKDEESIPAIQVSFVLAPISGVVLPRLNINEKVIVRFSNLKDPRTRSYIKGMGLDEEEKSPDRVEAVLKELKEAPSFGPNAVKALLELPGGTSGEAIEENRNIRVKTLLSEKRAATAKKSTGKATPQKTIPTLFVGIGVVAFFLGIVASILIFLLMD